MPPEHKAPARHILPLLLTLLTACGGGSSGTGQAPALPNASSPSDRVIDSHPGDTQGSIMHVGEVPPPGRPGNTTAPVRPPSSGNAPPAGTPTPGGTGPQASTETGSNGNVGGPLSGTLISSQDCLIDYHGKTLRHASGTDPLRHTQWYLQNTGQLRNSTPGIDLNLSPIWQRYRGEGIRVAVVDDALETTHDDLLPNVLPNASFNYRTGIDHGNAHPLPCHEDQSHGTAVAGIIAARDDNGVGIRGIAPRSGLIGLNALATGRDDHVLHALSQKAEQTHIYNNSWGSPDLGHFSPPSPSENIYRTTLNTQLKQGRNGLGPIYVFAAGNGAHDGDYSVYDGSVGMLGTLAICAHNAVGKRAFYSEPGPNLLVCGPSGDLDPNNRKPAVASTDIHNAYTQEFNGTSAAAPMASGVIALMLQANPRLTWRDVRLVLAYSARRIDPDNPGWTRHGSLHFNHEYGFGALDATAAVNLARDWKSVGGSKELKQCGPYQQKLSGSDALIPEVAPLSSTDMKYILRNIDPQQLDLTRPVAGSLQSRIFIPDDCGIRHIEHIEARVWTSRQFLLNNQGKSLGDLQISLTSPSGQTSTLSTPHLCFNSDHKEVACAGLDGFLFGITRHMEEPATTRDNRNWTLSVADRRVDNGKRASLQTWELTLYGR